MVGSGTRNARAISAVLSPPSSRSVSATCALAARAGWQQVKISRSLSSRTAATSSGTSCCSCSSAAWACRSSREASRRSRSMARRRAVVMIHPAGLGGSPSAGQRWTATAKASWTASSATSMSPKLRTRTATARPYSSRNTRSTPASGKPVTAVSAPGIFPVRPVPVEERPHLDRQPSHPDDPAAPLHRRVQILGLDDPEPADVLLALGVWTVGDQHLAALVTQHGGDGRRVQAAGEHPGARGLDLLVDRVELAHHLGQELRRRDGAFRLVHVEQVLRHGFLLRLRRHRPGSSPPTRTPRAQIDTARENS